MIRLMINGFCMALADSVPGVSGGTVAYILGFYEDFIDAICGLFGRDAVKRREGLVFLLKLAGGWVVGMTLAMLVLARILSSDIYALSSFFIGLTIASVPYVIVAEKDVLLSDRRNIVYTLIGTLVVAVLAYLETAVAAGGSLDYGSLALWQYPLLFLAGALAICAMVLPGISGSTMLLAFGVYAPTVVAVSRLLHADIVVFPGLIVFIAGIVFGAAVSVRFIRAAFQKHRSQTVYLVIGLLLGSLAAICAGPVTLKVPQAVLSLGTFDFAAFVIGLAVMIALEMVRTLLERRGNYD